MDGQVGYWQQHILPSTACELYQDAIFHDGPVSRARLDRCYVSQPVVDQFDKHVYAAALEWVPCVSAHRDVAFGRFSKARQEGDSSPIPEAVLKHPAWPTRTALEFQNRLDTAVFPRMPLVASSC